MYNLDNKISIHIMQGMQIIFLLLTNKSNQLIDVPFPSVTNNYTWKCHHMFVNNMIFKLMRIVDSKKKKMERYILFIVSVNDLWICCIVKVTIMINV